jgi:hypothetical protein
MPILRGDRDLLSLHLPNSRPHLLRMNPHPPGPPITLPRLLHTIPHPLVTIPPPLSTRTVMTSRGFDFAFLFVCMLFFLCEIKSSLSIDLISLFLSLSFVQGANV